MAHGNPNEIDLAVVVNGEPTVVQANINAPLGTIIPKALHQTDNVGQPPENWELKDGLGTPLDLLKKIKDFHFEAGVVLKLNLKAGIGG